VDDFPVQYRKRLHKKEDKTMEASKRIASVMLRTVAVIVIFFIINALYALYRGGNVSNPAISFTENQIFFSNASGEKIVIDYSDVVSMELLDSPDYGEPAGGTLENKIRLGTWKSEQMGTYTTYTSTEIESCILIRTSNGTYAINYESEETTILLLDELNKYL